QGCAFLGLPLQTCSAPQHSGRAMLTNLTAAQVIVRTLTFSQSRHRLFHNRWALFILFQHYEQCRGKAEQKNRTTESRGNA
ncbi:MAG TPA: hypothetical protein VJ798_10865, partial [Rhizomicrobium sp.]|nr:hypothetical protein [Rhizomicrobium sp.]